MRGDATQIWSRMLGLLVKKQQAHFHHVSEILVLLKLSQFLLVCYPSLLVCLHLYFCWWNSHVYDASCPCLLVKSVVESLTHGQANIPTEKRRYMINGHFRNRFIGGTYQKKAYSSGLNFREYLHHSYGLKYGAVSPFWVPKFPSML